MQQWREQASRLKKGERTGTDSTASHCQQTKDPGSSLIGVSPTIHNNLNEDSDILDNIVELEKQREELRGRPDNCGPLHIHAWKNLDSPNLTPEKEELEGWLQLA